jgi:hypothetical protein
VLLAAASITLELRLMTLCGLELDLEVAQITVRPTH